MNASLGHGLKIFILSWDGGKPQKSFKQGKGRDVGENGGQRGCRPSAVVQKK